MDTTLKHIDRLLDHIENREDVFYYEAIKQIKDFIVVEKHYRDLYVFSLN